MVIDWVPVTNEHKTGKAITACCISENAPADFITRWNFELLAWQYLIEGVWTLRPDLKPDATPLLPTGAVL